MAKIKITKRQIKNGTAEEMEHTSSKSKARKIAMDHLNERGDYYKKLKQAGLAESYARGGTLPLDAGNNTQVNWDNIGNFWRTKVDPTSLFNDNINNSDIATNFYGRSKQNEFLESGRDKGYSKLDELGKDYSTYKEGVDNVFNLNDPSKKSKFMDIFNPLGGINQDPQRQKWLQEANDSKITDLLSNPNELMRLAKDGYEGPVHSLLKQVLERDNTPMNPMTPMQPNLDTPIPDFNLEGSTTEKIPVEEEYPPETPDPGLPEWSKYAPMAFNALAPLLRDKPDPLKPSTMNIGNIDPNLVNEQAMRSGIDSSFRGGIGSLANATGGSGAAMRANMQGLGRGYMDATSNAFLQANQANNQARTRADMFNVGNQATAARTNMGAINQAKYFNTGRMDKFKDDNLSYLGAAAEDFGQIGQDNARYNMYRDVTGYEKTKYKPGKRTKNNALKGMFSS